MSKSSQEIKRELEALQSQLAVAEINERETETSEQLHHLLVDLRNEEDFSMCRTPLDTVGRVQFVFGSQLCRDTCGNYGTCKRISELTSKAKKNVRKSTGTERSGKVSSTNLQKKVAEGCIIIQDKKTGRVEFGYQGSSYSDYLDKLRAHFLTGKPRVVKSQFVGLTLQSVQGFEHKGANRKLYNKFIGA